MVELVKYLVTQLVDNKDGVVVTEAEGDVINVKVDKPDMGKVIGKQGRIAKAIRTVVKAAGVKSGKKYTVEILEADEPVADSAPAAAEEETETEEDA